MVRYCSYTEWLQEIKGTRFRQQLASKSSNRVRGDWLPWISMSEHLALFLLYTRRYVERLPLTNLPLDAKT